MDVQKASTRIALRAIQFPQLEFYEISVVIQFYADFICGAKFKSIRLNGVKIGRSTVISKARIA